MDTRRIIEGYKAEGLFERARKEFGVTEDYRVGAWVLPDGSMLNFGGRGVRREDHGAIKRVFDPGELEQEGKEYKMEDDYVREEFLKLGAVRLVSEGGGVEMGKKPTGKQVDRVEGFLGWLGLGEFYLNLGGEGKKWMNSYDNTVEGRERALSTIGLYYEGKLRNPSEGSKFRYADGDRRVLIRE